MLRCGLVELGEVLGTLGLEAAVEEIGAVLEHVTRLVALDFGGELINLFCERGGELGGGGGRRHGGEGGGGGGGGGRGVRSKKLGLAGLGWVGTFDAISLSKRRSQAAIGRREAFEMQ